MQEYTVQSNLQHNGETFTAGQTITLEDRFALPLLEAGVISTGDAERDAEAGHPGVTDAQVRQEEVKAVEAQLNGNPNPESVNGSNPESESPAQPDGGTGEPTPLVQQEEVQTPPQDPAPTPIPTDPLSDPTIAEDLAGTDPSLTPPSNVQIN